MAVGTSFSLGAAGAIGLPPLVQRILIDTKQVDLAAAQVGGKLQTILPTTARIGNALTRNLTLPLLAISGIAGKIAIDFESSFAGVRKTVDATEEEFAELAQGFRDLATEVPVSVNELNRIGELGGQLGIATENLIEFTDTIAKVAVTTNLTTEEAALGFARLANIMQTPQDEIENLASGIVDLGNNFATTEDEILNFALRIAGAAQVVGLTEGDVLGLAAAFSSVGIRAEAGGTAVQKVLIAMREATIRGGTELEVFAETAGVSAEKFSELFGDQPREAVVKFVEGIARINEEGKSVSSVLEALGLSNERTLRALLASSAAADQFAEALRTGNVAFDENTALTEEANKRFETFQSRLKLVGNALQDVLIDVGAGVVSMLEPVLGLVGGAAEVFGKLPEPVQRFTGQLAILLALLGPGLLLFTKLTTSLIAMRATIESLALGRVILNFIGLGSAASGAATGVARLGTALKGLGIAAVVFGLIELVQAIRRTQEEADKLASKQFPGLVLTPEEAKAEEERLDALILKIRALREEKIKLDTEGGALFEIDLESQTQSIEEQFRELSRVAQLEIDRLTQAQERGELGSFWDRVLGLDLVERNRRQDAIKQEIAQIEQALQIARDAAAGALDLEAFDAFNRKHREAIGLRIDLVQQAIRNDRDAAAVVLALAAGNEELARQLASAGSAASGAASGVGQLSAAAEITADNIEDVNERLAALASQAAAFVDATTGEALSRTKAKFDEAQQVASGGSKDLADTARNVESVFQGILSTALGASTEIIDEQNRAVEEALAERDRLIEQRAREAEAIADRIIGPTLRGTRLVFDDELGRLVETTEGALADALSFGDFAQGTRENILTFTEFFDNLKFIAANGGKLLASELAEMGVEGAVIAEQAVKRIVGGQGVGALESDLAEAIQRSKQFGLDAELLKFKPNIEDEGAKNIIDPLTGVFRKAPESAIEAFEQSLSQANFDASTFLADLRAISEAGGVILAKTLAEMGEDGALIAREAVARIVSGEGIGALEEELRTSIAIAKAQGLDPALQAFKPNIEEQGRTNISGPLKKVISGEELLKGLQDELPKLLEEERQFMADLNLLVQGGFLALASTFAEGGEENRKLARAAVVAITSGEGLGSLENDLRETILLAKERGLDPALQRFKPNIEQVGEGSINVPIRQILDQVLADFEDATQGPEALLLSVRIGIANIREIMQSAGDVADPIEEAFLTAARAAEDPTEAADLLRAAIALIGLDADASLTPAQTKLADLALSAKDPETRARAIRDLLAEIGQMNPKAKIDLDTSAIDAVKGDIEALQNKTIKVPIVFVDQTTGTAFGGDQLGTQVTGVQTRHEGGPIEIPVTPLPPEALLFSQPLGFFHSGGPLQRMHSGGPGLRLGPRDVPLIGELGEYIINKDSTRKHLDLLRAINADRFHSGGPVERYHDGGSVAVSAGSSTLALSFTFNAPVGSPREWAREAAPAIAGALEQHRLDLS